MAACIREVFLPDEATTRALAGRLAGWLEAGDVVTLTGDLGAGKTALARALVQAMGDPDAEVPSPTFTLVQTYETPAGTVWHFDLYRIGDSGEALELGWDEARAGGIVLVEWADRLGTLIPADRLDVTLTVPDGGTETARAARLSGHGGWAGRLRDLMP